MCLREHSIELRADLQRYYGLNIEDAGSGYSVYHAACLVSCLPQESATFRAIDPDSCWGLLETLLVRIEHDLAIANWLNSKDGEKGRNRPKPIQTRKKQVQNADRRGSFDIDELNRRLALPREEVK